MSVSSNVLIHQNVRIHPTVIIEGEVEVGEGTTIGPYSYLRGPIVIGSNNKISSHVIIGEEPEHRTKIGKGLITIGDNNVIRELTIIHRGVGEQVTEIGNGCYLMDHCHLSHDCSVGDRVTLAHNTVLAGHSRILEGATTGIATVIHQWSILGSYVMTGMGSVVTRDVPPFCLVKGNPARFSRLNRHVFPLLEIDEDDFQIQSGVLFPASDRLSKYFSEFNQYSSRAQVPVSILSQKV